jgi:hypothetical protein
MSVYPGTLSPTSIEPIRLPNGRIVGIPKATPSFKLWSGKTVQDTYGHKTVLHYRGKPAFAELIVLRSFIREGWNGVWVDGFRGKFRTQYWPANQVELPSRAERVLDSIKQTNGSARGCWDVFCWKGNAVLFIECKRSAKDSIRDSQRKWLASALKSGMSRASFMIVEWTASLERAAKQV